MLAKRIIPCLDVKDGKVVKGIQFRDHEIVGDIVALAQFYRDEGADELVLYDITASGEGRTVDIKWVSDIAARLDIPFCVAGGIRALDQARAILFSGADKISINSPALENPQLIDSLASEFGTQCIVVGIDSHRDDDAYHVYQYTGDAAKTIAAKRETMAWAREAVDRGAGEIVLNCMNRDGMRNGYDVAQLKQLREEVNVPVIASGGAGLPHHFLDVFVKAGIDGALAASIFHKRDVTIQALKSYLSGHDVEIRA